LQAAGHGHNLAKVNRKVSYQRNLLTRPGRVPDGARAARVADPDSHPDAGLPRADADSHPDAAAAGSGNCAAAWANNMPYVSGNVASFNGHNWTANQWNYDEVPGGASGAWNDNGAC